MMASEASAFTLIHSQGSVALQQNTQIAGAFQSHMTHEERPSSETSEVWAPSQTSEAVGKEHNNLVNSSESRRDKQKFMQTPLLYLFEAHEIISRTSCSPKSVRKEFENQSFGSDYTNWNSNKRFQMVVSPCKQEAEDKVNQADSLSSGKVSFDSLQGVRGRKFGDRPDVIYKTILRSFKKYYLNEFNEVTDYKKKKRRVANQAFLLDMTEKYASQKFLDSPFQDLGLFIAALVQPKLPEALGNHAKLQELSQTVCEVLYRFNKSKMNALLSFPQFSYILKQFLGIDDLFEFIGDKSTAPQAAENLKAQVDFLVEQCDYVLSSKSGESKFGEGSQTKFQGDKPGNK